MRRTILLAIITALLPGALVAPAGAGPTSFEASGSFVVGGEDGWLAGGSSNVTKREFVDSCEIPTTQGVEGYVIQLPGALSQFAGEARVEWTQSTPYDDIFMEFYGSECGFNGQAGIYDAYGESEEVGSFPAGTSYVLVAATRGLLVEFVLTVTPAGSDPGPPAPQPIPSPIPSPSPSPTAAPAHSHARTVDLSLRRHVVAAGAVATTDGSDECISKVTVEIEKKARSGWTPIATVTTTWDGSFRARIADLPGRYRAQVAATTQDPHTCESATSPVRTHRHD